jgi:hypothetical protein
MAQGKSINHHLPIEMDCLFQQKQHARETHPVVRVALDPKRVQVIPLFLLIPGTANQKPHTTFFLHLNGKTQLIKLFKRRNIYFLTLFLV